MSSASSPPDPVVTLQEKQIDFAEQEWIFCKETGIKQLGQKEALAYVPLPVFAKNVTLKAKNVYLSASLLEVFTHLQHEWDKPRMPGSVLDELKHELARLGDDDDGTGEDSNSSESKKDGPDVRLPPVWRRNYLYELIPENTPCHLYFDIDGKVPEGETRDDLEHKQGVLFRVCCEELQKLMAPQPIEVSMFVLDASNECKFSRHLILRVPGFAFVNNAHCGAFVRCLYAKHADKLEGAGIDLGVYTLNRLFRAAYCSKGNDPRRVLRPYSVITSARTARLPPSNPRRTLFYESLITNVFLFHRSDYIKRVQMISFDAPFLAYYGTKPKRKRAADSEHANPKRTRSSSATGGTRATVWGNALLMRCQRDIEAAYDYQPKDFAEQATALGDPAEYKTAIFPITSGACSFRPGRPHSHEHSYVIVDLDRGVFRALCHSEKTPCLEDKACSVWRELSGATRQMHKANTDDNLLILNHLPPALLSSEIKT